jgi:protein O-GlcNAc transferase
MADEAIEEAFSSALKLHHAGRLNEAARIYGEILQKRPDCAEALHHLGIIEAQAGRNGSAINLIRRAIALKPGFVEAHHNLGHVLVNGPEPEEAVRAYREAVALRADR